MELLSLTVEEITEALHEMSLPAFRGRQVLQWLHKGAEFEDMLNLPVDLRKQMKASFTAQPVRIREVLRSQKDDTVKLLFELQDGQCVEGVLMHYRHGRTLCLSTQAGCAMGCVFCQSALDGCSRNLTAGEMLGQILCANRFLGEGKPVSHVVLMGSGEPLANYDRTIRFLRLLREPGGVMIGMRNVSLSTCGIVPRMYDLAGEGLPVTLSVSLHAPNDTVRQRLMPVAERYPLKDVLEACRNYIKVTGRRVIFEYVLIAGVNDAREHARELAERLHRMQCHVNLITLNAAGQTGLRPAAPEDTERFLATLTDLRISVTKRRETGEDIRGACGQLRRSASPDRGG
jgi:23S rRNA (adenine2503-C2)-methyltransferase